MQSTKGAMQSLIFYTNTLDYKDFKVEISSVSIIVSRQDGHTNYEQVAYIPIEVLRLFCEK